MAAVLRFVNGWKTWIWAVVVALHKAFPDWPLWGYVDAGANAVGWANLVPAVDPSALLSAVWFLWAASHKLVKAYREYKAGIPLAEVGSSPLDQSVAVVRVGPLAPTTIISKTSEDHAPATEKVVIEPVNGKQ